MAWLWRRGRSGGDPVMATRGTPPVLRGTWNIAQAWSSGGGVRLLVGRMQFSRAADDGPPLELPVTFRFEHGSYEPGSMPYPYERYLRAGDVARNAAGFEVFSRDYDITTYRERFWSVTLPMWALILLALGLPARTAAQLWQARRARRRLATDMCPACGYDLRGSPDRCPECGR